MKQPIRCAVLVVLIATVVYNSIYFKRLDEVKSGKTVFNAAKYADKFWTSKLVPATSKAIEIGELTTLLKTQKDKAFAYYSHALGIGNIKFFLVKGRGNVESVGENQVMVKVESAFEQPELNIATEYIFGNAVRDASGSIDINEFSNSMDFNNVSAEINKIIREKVVPEFKAKVKKGDIVEFSGAIELNQEHLDLRKIEVIPVSCKIINKN
jgi:predicted lipoprotein